MSETSMTREAVRVYVDSTEQRDWQRLSDLLTEDMVYEMPQARERIRGRSAFLRFYREYPGDWHIQVRLIVADGRHAAAWIDARVGAEHQDACAWFDFSDGGLITRIVDFWPESYAPPPGREHLVERW